MGNSLGLGLGLHKRSATAIPWYTLESFYINDAPPTLFADMTGDRLAVNQVEEAWSSRLTCTRSHSSTATATYHDQNGYIQVAIADTVRWDYDPTTLALNGILIEKASSNVIRHSENISSWTATNATVANDAAVVNPKGTTGAYKVTEDTATGEHSVNITANAGGTQFSIHSCFFKVASGTPNVCISGWNSSAGHFYSLTINPTTGAIVASTGGANLFGVKVIQYPNGWWRAIAIGNAPNTKSDFIYVRMASGSSTSYAGNGTNAIYVWGAMREDNIKVPTSYIPNELGTLTATRNADAVQMDMTGWFNGTEGTILAAIKTLTEGAVFNRPAVCFDDGTANEQIKLYFGDNASDSLAADIIDGGVSQFDSDTFSYVSGNTQYLALAYKANDCISAMNENLGVLDTSATLPTVTTCRLGGSQSGENLCGWIQKFVYVNERVPDLEVLRTASEMYYAE